MQIFQHQLSKELFSLTIQISQSIFVQHYNANIQAMTQSKHSPDISLCLHDLVEAGAPLAGEEEDTEAGEADREEEEGEGSVPQHSHHILLLISSQSVSPHYWRQLTPLPCY